MGDLPPKLAIKRGKADLIGGKTERLVQNVRNTFITREMAYDQMRVYYCRHNQFIKQAYASAHKKIELDEKKLAPKYLEAFERLSEQWEMIQGDAERKSLEELKDKSARIIQKAYRHYFQLRNKSAKLIQDFYREYQQKKQQSAISERLELENEAASRIQEVYKKYLHRKFSNKLLYKASETPNIPGVQDEYQAKTSDFPEDSSGVPLLYTAGEDKYFLLDFFDSCDGVTGKCLAEDYSAIIKSYLQNSSGSYNRVVMVSRDAFHLNPVSQKMESNLLLPLFGASSMPKFWPSLIAKYKNGMSVVLRGNQFVASFDSKEAFTNAVKNKKFVGVLYQYNSDISDAINKSRPEGESKKLSGKGWDQLRVRLDEKLSSWEIKERDLLIKEVGIDSVDEHLKFMKKRKTAEFLVEIISEDYLYSKKEISFQTLDIALQVGSFQCDIAAVIMIAALKERGVDARMLRVINVKRSVAKNGESISVYASNSLGHALVEVLLPSLSSNNFSGEIFDPTPKRISN